MMKYISLVFIAFLLLTGCVEPVDIDFGKNRQPVVNCILTRDSIQRLTLTYSGTLKDNFYDEIPDAKVGLYANGELIGEFKKTSYAGWELKYRPWMGQKYELKVEIPGVKTLTATTTVPKRLPITRAKEIDKEGKRYFRKNETDVFWTFAFEKPEDIYMRPVVIDKKFLLHSSIGSNFPAIDDFTLDNLDESDVTQKKYRTYMRFLPDDNQLTFYLEKLYSCVVVFRAVSPEYDQYLKTSITKMFVYHAFYDPTQWLDESEIYTNINNGLGIFGAYHDLMFNCNDNLPE